MADRVSASIALGGTVSATQLAELTELINDEGLSTEWGGEPFNSFQLTPGEPLQLHAHEVTGGMFEELETWCREHRVPHVRWSGGYGCEWGAERVVFDGDGDPRSYDADENDRIFVDRATVQRLGSFEAILAHFDAAEFACRRSWSWANRKSALPAWRRSVFPVLRLSGFALPRLSVFAAHLPSIEEEVSRDFRAG